MASAVEFDDDGSRLNAAAVWYARLRSEEAGAESVWVDFGAWLAEGDANRSAFDKIEMLYAELDDAAPALDSPTLSEAPGISNVVALTARRPLSWRVGVGGLAALAASLALFAAVRLTWSGDDTVRYATRPGETRTVSLADGSVIEMNTASTLAVTFTGRERRIALDQGEALFRVAPDAARPFLVVVAGRDVRDIGTVFNILRDHGRVVVTVESGKVSISRTGASSSDEVIQLAAGEQLAAQDGAGQVVGHVDPAQVTSWRDGYLTYKEAPLSVVVADLNRYFPDRIVLADKDAGVRRFSGVLKVDDEDAVLNRLTQLLPLVVDRKGSGEVGLRLKRQGD